MAEVEYLGGLPGRAATVPVAATVRSDTLQLAHRRLFGGWTSRTSLAGVVSAELIIAREVVDAGLLPAMATAGLDEPQERLLAVAAPASGQDRMVVLRGPWATLSALRQAILQGRMHAAKQWHS